MATRTTKNAGEQASHRCSTLITPLKAVTWLKGVTRSLAQGGQRRARVSGSVCSCNGMGRIPPVGADLAVTRRSRGANVVVRLWARSNNRTLVLHGRSYADQRLSRSAEPARRGLGTRSVV